jgi:benzoate/toluate 1,2-dioxygenase beta subunit
MSVMSIPADANAVVVADTSSPTIEEISRFLYIEARLQDEHAYDEWESLWTEDASYWVPMGGDDTNPETQISIIYDNRARIATRIRQLKTGKRYSQMPQSTLRRIVSNIEIHDGDGPEIAVSANFVLVEWRLGESRVWAGRTHYGLRVLDGALRLARKKVLLINSAEETPTLAFLI